MKSGRTYSMATRDRALERNRAAVRQAVVGLAAERRLADISLGAVAERAAVSVRTLLRYYGTREGLLRTVAEEMQATVLEERPVFPDDVDRSLGLLGDHYEARGRLVAMLLAQEDTDPIARAITSEGKGFHRRWVAALFGLDPDRGDHAEPLDLLVVATDLSTWRLLRIDRGLGPDQTLDRMRLLVAAVRSQFATSRGA